MRLCIYLLLFIFADEVSAQDSSETYCIKWRKERKLEYSDFRFRRDLDTNGYLATYVDSSGAWMDTVMRDFFIDDPNILYYGLDDTFAHSHIELDRMTDVKSNVLKFYIVPIFYPERSFMRIKTQDILHHEQNHFNIAELYARKLRKYYRLNINKQNYKNASLHVRDICDEHVRTHKTYDRDAIRDFYETGNLYRSDSVWSKKIDAQLDLMNAYEKPDGTVFLK